MPTSGTITQFAKGEKEGLLESHHGFLVPARSSIDNLVLDLLVQAGPRLLDEELVADVLAVDLTTPVFSKARASLLQYVPDKAKNADDLREQLIAALRKAPAADNPAKALLANLTDPTRDAKFHAQAASDYLAVCGKAAEKPEAIGDWSKVAAQRRREIETAETAQHPDKQFITEPGFRVIFPVIKRKPTPGEFFLDPTTGLVGR